MATTSSNPQTVERAADFVNGAGVNIHLGQPGYSATAIIADMAYLGLNNVRTQAMGQQSPLASVYGKLASAGLKFDWLAGGQLTPTLSALDSFLAAHPGAIKAIEGPNEVDNFPIAYGGLTGTAAALAYQQALYAAVKTDPLTSAIPVLDFTDSTLQPTAAADAANLHPYAKSGGQPSIQLTAAETAAARLMPGAPIYVTEAGYFNLPGSYRGWEGVDSTTQAKMTLNLLMDAASTGVSETYLYDLVDDGVDASNTFGPDHFGLFTYSGQAKPVATAIHNLTTILADPGANAAAFTPTQLGYTIKGLTVGSSFLIEKSSGVYDLVIWAEPPIWTTKTHSGIVANAESVTVTFASAATQYSVFDPLKSAKAIATGAHAASVKISVTDHPLIIQVSGFAQAMASFASPAGAGPVGASLIAPPATPTLVTPKS